MALGPEAKVERAYPDRPPRFDEMSSQGRPFGPTTRFGFYCCALPQFRFQRSATETEEGRRTGLPTSTQGPPLKKSPRRSGSDLVQATWAVRPFSSPPERGIVMKRYPRAIHKSTTCETTVFLLFSRHSRSCRSVWRESLLTLT